MRSLLPFLLLAVLSLACLPSCGDPVDDGATFSSQDPGDPTQLPQISSGDGEANALPAGDLKRIAFLSSDLQEPFRAVQANLVAAAMDGARFQIDFYDAVGDPQAQLSQLSEAIASRPAAIAIYPFRADDLVGPLGEAKQAGIPIVLLCPPPAGAPYDAAFYTDQFAVGKMAGEFVLQRLKVKMQSEGDTEVHATLFEITGTDLECDTSRLRSEGFHSVFADVPGLQLLHQAPGMWNERDAASSMVEASQVQGRADVIFCHSDAMAHGAYLAGRKLGNHTSTLFMGIDGVGGARGGIAKVRDQMFAGTVSVPLLGNEIAEALTALAEGGQPAQKDTAAAPELVTIANSSQMLEKHSSVGAGAEVPGKE